MEKSLGTPLPSDYKQVMTAYGSGIFNDLFWLFNPISHSDRLNLISQAHGSGTDYPHLKCYEHAKAVWPERCPFPAYPEPGGLLPLGGDTNGGYAFWLTEGPPDDWTLVLYPHGFFELERHPMPLTGFLTLWLSGHLPEGFFGAGKSFTRRTDPIFQNKYNI